MPSRAEYMRHWRAANREKSRALERASYARHAEKRRQEKREYYQLVRKQMDATPEGRLKDLNRKHRRRSWTRTGNVSPEEWATILANHNHRCAYCRTSDQPLEMDHVIPLSKGGPHCATNIVPACKPCNSSKGDR